MKPISLLRSITPLILALVLLSAAGLPEAAHSSTLPSERPSSSEGKHDARTDRDKASEVRESRPGKPDKGRAQGKDGSEEVKPERSAPPGKRDEPSGEEKPPTHEEPPSTGRQDDGLTSRTPESSPTPKTAVAIEEISIDDPCRVSGVVRLSGPYTGRVTLRLTYHVIGSPDYVPSDSSWSYEFDDETDAGYLLSPPWDSGWGSGDEAKISSYRVAVEEADPAFTNMTVKSAGFRCDQESGGGATPSTTPTATSEPSPTPGATTGPEPTGSTVPTLTSTPEPTPGPPSPTTTTTPRPVGGTRIVPDNQSRVYPGAVAIYGHSVTNLGPSADAKEISASSSLDWPISVFGADGVTPLGDSNRNGSIDTGLLDPGESRAIVVKVTVPVNARRDTRDITTISARSSSGFDPAGSDSATDTTTVLGVIALSVSTPDVSFGGVSPTGALSAGVTDVWSEADDLGAHYVKSPAVQITVSSNSTWTGEVRAIENSGTASTIRIADGDLQWRLHGDESWTSLSLSSTDFASGSAGSSSMEHDYRLRVDWVDDPGGFTSVVSYNVSQ